MVDLLVDFLHFDVERVIDEQYLTKVFEQIYGVLLIYMRGSSKKNSLYLAKYIEFFEKQLSLKVQNNNFILNES